MRSHRLLHGFPCVLRAAAVLLCMATAPAFFTGCIFGGTGTDTDNGVVVKDKGPLSGATATAARVVDSDGKPMSGVSLSLHTPAFRPDSSAAQILIVDSAVAMVSDSLGYVRFELLQPGKYVVEGRLAGATLFFDTLAVSDVKALAAYTFRARTTMAAKGTVWLASGLKVDSGSVFVRGTGRYSRLDSAGGYDLGILPVDAGELAIGLTYKASIREARIAEQKPPPGPGMDTLKVMPPLRDTVKPVFACREVSTDSAARFSKLQPIASDPAGASPGAFSYLAPDTGKLDTAKVAGVARSCDSLSGGTVIAVKSAPTVTGIEIVKKDSVTTNLIAVDAVAARSANPVFQSDQTAIPLLIPLIGCVPAPGAIRTTYDVRLLPAGSVLFVEDIAGKCLSK